MLLGLLLAVAAVAMLEQSARWVLTSLTHSNFIKTEFEVDNLRDEGGEGGFSVHGRIVPSGEQVYTDETHVVPLARLRELQAAGKIPGAREPVYYLPADAPLAFLHPTIRFRLQAPGEYETDAFGWSAQKQRGCDSAVNHSSWSGLRGPIA
ncbi:MAG: hypothetical protein ABIT71_10045 [Vicinamibacteraceae bacterium]